MYLVKEHFSGLRKIQTKRYSESRSKPKIDFKGEINFEVSTKPKLNYG